MARKKKEYTYMDLCGVSDCRHCSKVSCMWNEGYRQWRRDVLMPCIEAARAARNSIDDNRPLSWSVGKYRGRHRKVIAWFSDENSARDYASRMRKSDPCSHFDYSKSLF